MSSLEATAATFASMSLARASPPSAARSYASSRGSRAHWRSALLGLVSSVVWVIATISVLVSERYPESLWNFQSGIVRWEARLLAYLASIVEPYPPFSLDTPTMVQPAT